MTEEAYVIMTGECVACHRPFTFNPNKVPSVRVDGVRRPVCRSCVDAANPVRKERGLPEIVVQPGAYEAARESEINWED